MGRIHEWIHVVRRVERMKVEARWIETPWRIEVKWVEVSCQLPPALHGQR